MYEFLELTNNQTITMDEWLRVVEENYYYHLSYNGLNSNGDYWHTVADMEDNELEIYVERDTNIEED